MLLGSKGAFIIVLFACLSVFTIGLVSPAEAYLEDPEPFKSFPHLIPEINNFTGAANQRIRIQVPPGRNGIEPELYITYYSYRQNGWLGVGWQLEIDAIRRQTQCGVRYNQNKYELVTRGKIVKLVPIGNDDFRARIETDFTKYHFHRAENYWEVTNKVGVKHYFGFGSNTESRQINAQGTFKWCLAKVQDTNSNYMIIDYLKDKGQIYPQQIEYTGNSQTSLSPANKVVFVQDTVTRPDDEVSYLSQTAVRTVQRLKSIKTYAFGNQPADQLTLEYCLEYDLSPSSRRSMLKKIRIIGADGNTELPSYTFAYQNGTHGSMGGGANIESIDLKDADPHFADVNGDNKDDLVLVKDSSLVVHLSNGNGTFGGGKSSYCYSPVEWASRHNYFVDINGDGKPDYIRYEFAEEDGDIFSRVIINQIRIFLSSGNGAFSLVSQIDFKVMFNNWYDNFGNLAFCDFNRDGYNDIYFCDSSGKEEIYYSNGQGSFIGPDSCNLPLGHSIRHLFADVNGDGLTDLINYYYLDSQYSPIVRKFITYLANGNDGGFVQVNEQYFNELFPDNHNFPINCREGELLKIHFKDANNDNRADLVIKVKDTCSEKTYIRTYLSDGNGNYHLYSERKQDNDITHLADLNADGIDDFIEIKYLEDQGDVGDPVVVDNYINSTLSLNTAPFDLLQEAISPSGAKMTYQYRRSTEVENHHFLPFIVYPVATLSVEDGVRAEPSTSTYLHEGGYFDAAEREYRGFEVATRTHPDGSVTKTHHYLGYSGRSDFPEDCYYFKGRIRQVDRYASQGGSLLTQTKYVWDKAEYATYQWAFVKLIQSCTEHYDNETVYIQKNYAYDDTNGNLLTAISSGTDAENIRKTYGYTNYGDWLWRKTQESVESGSISSSSSKVQETYFEYENNTGNLISKELWLDSGINPREEMTYDNNGNRISLTDARGNSTTTEYDTDTYAYPVRIVYPATGDVSHIEEFQYDYRYGKMSGKKDQNGNWTYYDFDPFGRIKQVDLPDGGQKIYEYYECNDPQCVDTIFPRYVIQKVKEDNSGSYIDKYRYFDGLSREIQAITLGENGKSIVTRRFYDEMGRNNLNEGPFFSTGTGYPKEPPTDYFREETFFDERGRPVEISSPHGEHGTVSTNFNYSGFSEVTTDPDGNQKTLKKDYLGRIIQVIEHAGTGRQYTNYTYNAAGDMLGVTNHYGETTTINYDTLGRKISMDDPDMGFWQYVYDANGNLIDQIDAKGQFETKEYDELNRMTLKSYSLSPPTDIPPPPPTGIFSSALAETENSTSTPTVIYTYDDLTITNGIGRLYSVTNSDVTTVYNAYDEMGREKSVTKTITGAPSNYTTSYDYDLSGKLISTTYPDNYHVNYDFYPGTGLLHTVAGITDLVSYATCTDYEPTGKIGKIEHGNDTATRYTYDPLSTKLFGIMTQDPSWVPENDLQRRQYSYTPAGDIKEIVDDLKGITYTYTYDKLHRLISETNTGDYNPAENPDKNRYTYIYSNNHINAVNQISLNGTDYYYTYDDNGNMNSGPDFTDPLQIASRVMEFNADNMPIRIEHAIGEDVLSTGIIYDGDGVRAKKTIYEVIQLKKKIKVREWSTTYYIGKHFEVADRNAVKYIFAGNLRIAKVTDSATHYFHKDHLSSSVAMTDENGTAVETSGYMPFGHERDHTGTDLTDYKFTDQELDTETGLYNYNARLYDPVIGRFISPDTILPDMYDPQSLNRYSYCLNNPLIYTDPTGHYLDGDNNMDTQDQEKANDGNNSEGITPNTENKDDNKTSAKNNTINEIEVNKEKKTSKDKTEVSTIVVILSDTKYVTTQAGKDMLNLAIYGDPFAKTALGIVAVTTTVPAVVAAAYYSPTAVSVVLANPQTITATQDIVKSMFPGTTPTLNPEGIIGWGIGEQLGTGEW